MKARFFKLPAELKKLNGFCEGKDITYEMLSSSIIRVTIR